MLILCVENWFPLALFPLRPRRSVIRRALCGALLLSTACYHWNAATPYVSTPSRVRIVRRDGSALDGTMVRRTADSAFVEVGDRIQSLAIGDIRSIETRTLGPRRSFFVAAFLLTGAVLVVKAGGTSGTGDLPSTGR